jgi:mannosyltransferase OCH1-like enzyme
VQSSVNSWKRTNPGFVHKMHDDTDIEERVRTLHPELLYAFSLMKPIQKADLLRYMVLHDEGGYYADCDVDCIVPIHRWVSQYYPRDFHNVQFIGGFEIVTGRRAVEQHHYARQFQLVQWTMGSAPGHPILKRVLENIRRYFADGKHLTSKSIIKSTGPGIWSDAITQTMEESYGVVFGLNETHAGDDTKAAFPYSHRDMHRKGAHIGDVRTACCLPPPQ